MILATLRTGLFVSAFALLGCNPVHKPIQGRLDPYASHQILFTGATLSELSAVKEPILSRDTYGYLHVAVPIRSAVDHDLRVDYQTQFFDSTGVAIETSAWQSVSLPANTPMQVRDVCTSPAAINFQMTFRPAQ